MRSPVARSGFLMMVLVVLGVSGCGRAKTEDAYVTLLYGDEFLLGVRVLGKSIRDTGSTKDMVVLVSDGVSEYAKKLLDWMVKEEELRVIHYTLGPLKPWDWWTAWLLKPVDVWQNVRKQLGESLPGTGGGRDPHDQLLVKTLCVFPVCLLFLFYYGSFLQIIKDFTNIFSRNSICDYARRIYQRFRSGGLPAYSGVGVAPSSFVNPSQQFSGGSHYKLPAYLGAMSVFVCFMAAAVSLGLSFVLVPRQVMPWTGLLLMYEWSFMTFFLIFRCYLNFIHQWGNWAANQTNYNRLDSDSGKGSQRSASGCDVVAWFYWLGMAVLAIVAPSLPCLLGITALFTRLGLMIGGGFVLAAFVTFASEHLAVRAFLKGYEDRPSAKV